METTYVNSSELGIESYPDDSTVVELLKSRKTHTKWLNRSVEDYKREQILKAAYLAPSKQSSKPYTIMQIGDSETGRRIKNNLFTKVCIAEPIGWKGGDYENSGDRPTNGQLRAPLVLAFGFRPVQFLDLPSGQRESLHGIESNADEMLHTYHKEVMFSAMCSIITAESLGLQTGCVACIMNQHLCVQTLKEVYPYHDDPQAYVSLFIGIGYADGSSQSTGVDIKPSFDSIVRPLI